MRFGTLVLAAMLMAILGGGASGQGLEINEPAEVPPLGFTGRQYVDSAGCAFVRAGYGSSVNWVARVGRDRKHLCGFAPTPVTAVPAPEVAALASSASLVPAGPRQSDQPMPTIAQITPPPSIGLAAPAPQPVARAKAREARTAPVVAARHRALAAPLTIVSSQTIAGGKTACPNLSQVAQRYMLSDGRRVVRCGPQTEDPVGYINRAGVPGLRVVGPAPATVAAARSVSVVPKGYQPAWRDNRLNPRRGPVTATGDAQMARIWTKDVPARLQRQTPAPLRGSNATAPAAERFVQVGIFGEPANAVAVKARLRAMGLPVATARLVRGGRDLQVVLAGPFDTAQAQAAALMRARQAGFGDAFDR